MWGPKYLNNPGPLHSRPKARAEENIEAEGKREKPKPSRGLAEDAHLLGQPTLIE